MGLKEQLKSDMAAAMKSGDTEKRDVLRMLMAAIKQTEIDDRVELDDKGVQTVLTKQAKQRRESIADYEMAGRDALAEQEKSELVLIEAYLPQMMSREEVEKIASAVVAELGVSGPQAMGQVMGKLMPQVKGKADGRLVNEVVRTLLNN